MIEGGAGGMSIAPSSDAIAEFRTLTSNYSADYGLSSGRNNGHGAKVRNQQVACLGVGV